MLTLDGNGDYIEIAHNSALNPASWTIEGWFNTTHSGTANSDINRIVSKISDTGWNVFTLQVYDGKLGTNTNSGSNTNFVATSTTTVNDGEWHHAAATFDGTNLKLYVDGVLEATTSFSGTVDYGGQSVNIGRSYDPVNGSIQYFDGSLDEVRIWSTARSQADIQSTMNTSLTGSETNLLAAYSFDDDPTGTGQTHTSTTGNYNGTGHGNVTVTDSTTSPVDARTGSLSNGNVLTLDGTGDYVTAGTPASINMGAAFTVEAWIKTSATSEQGIFSKANMANWGAAGEYGKRLVLTADGQLRFDEAHIASHTGTSVLNDGQWHHVAVTASGPGGTLQLFVDGELETLSSGNGSITLNADNGAHTVQIGSSPNLSTPGSHDSFNGQMDEVRIWSDVRSQSEIQTHMHDTLTDAPSGLVAYYTFDDDLAGTSQTHYDTTTTANGTGQGDATVTATTDTPVNSSPMIVKDQGKTLSFDGTDSLDIVDTNAFDTTSYTIETWVRFDAVDNRTILGRTDSNGLAGGAFSHFLATDADGKIYHYTFSTVNGGHTAFSQVVAQVGQWYHLAGTYDAATDTLKLFVNGTLVATTTGVGDIWGGGDRYQIGTAISGDNRFAGDMGELRIWNTARTDAEIAENYNATLTGSESGLLGLYDFEGTSGTSVPNEGSANTANTISGATVVDVSAPIYGNAFVITEGETASGRMTANDVTTTSTVSYSAVQPSAGNGTVAIDSATGQWVYTPPANHSGTITFQVRATSGGVTDTETITVTVKADHEPDVHGSVLQLNGAGDHVDLGSLSGISGAYTIEAWVNAAAANTFSRIVDLGQGDTNDNILLAFNGSAGTIVFENYVGATKTSVSTTAQLPLNQWVHVAAVNNGDGTVAIYFNGVAQSVTGNTTDFSTAANVVRDESYIGRSNWEGDEYFKGMMDDVRIWNDARTATEVADNYNQRLGGGEDNLYAYYTFDSVKGAVVDDQAPGDHDAVLKGAQSPVTSSNVLSLDGTDDYVAISNEVLNNRSTGTIEAWVYLDENGAATITSKQHDGVNTTALFQVGDVLDAANAGKLVFRPTNGKVAVGATTVTTGTWHHVAVSWTDTQVNLYLDGQLDATVNGTGFSVPNTAGGKSAIGSLVQENGVVYSNAGNSSLDGQIDEVRIWSTTRTQQEIAQNMNDKVDGTSTGLVAQYSFDSDNPASSGTVDNGQGTSSRDGTLTNGAQVTATTSDHVRAEEATLIGPSGNVMNIVDVNGSATRDDLSASFADSTITTAVTLEAWVKFDRANVQENFMFLGTQTDVGGKSNPRFVLVKNADGTFQFWLQDDDASHGSTLTTTTNVLDVGVWQHVAVTYDTATDLAKIYVDGAEVASKTVTDFTLNTGTAQLFSAGSDNGGFPMDGQMDNVRVWSEARTVDQIREGMTQSYDYDTSNLVGQYTFDDVSGTTVRDTALSYSGTTHVGGQDGTLNGSATIVDSGTGGPIVTPGFDNAVSFDGTNDLIDFTAPIAPTGTAARTFMLWARSSSTASQTLIDYGANTGGVADQFQFGINQWDDNGNNRGISLDAQPGAITWQPATSPTDGQWHHYAIVIPAGGSLRDILVYQDGVLLTTVSALYNNDNAAINTSVTGNLRLGSQSDGNRDFNGQMAEVSVWSTALSGSQINDYMTQSLSGEEAGLSGYWKLDEGSGTSVGDSSNGGHDGTITGATWVTGLAPDIEGTTHHIVEDGSASGQMTSADVTGTPSYTLIGNPSFGAVDLDGTTGRYTYTPNTDYQGNDSFTIRATGATSGVDEEQINVTVGEAPSLTENHALKLDGSGDFVDIGVADAFVTGSNDFTVEAWIKTSYTGGRQDIFSWGNTSGADNTGGYLYVDQTSGNLRYGQSGVFGPTGGAVADGTWHHVAVTSTSGTMQLYIDGTASGGSAALSPGMTGGAGVIGRSVIGDINFFNGEIDEVRLWDKARSQAEISADMDRQLNGDEANLAGYWNFNEGAGTAAADGSANNNDGLLVGDASYEDLSRIEMGNSQTYKGMLLGEDADGDGLSYAISGNPAAGTFTLDANSNTYTYVSDGTDGEFTATIDITDDHGQTSSETLVFQVT